MIISQFSTYSPNIFGSKATVIICQPLPGTMPHIGKAIKFLRKFWTKLGSIKLLNDNKDKKKENNVILNSYVLCGAVNLKCIGIPNLFDNMKFVNVVLAGTVGGKTTLKLYQNVFYLNIIFKLRSSLIYCYYTSRGQSHSVFNSAQGSQVLPIQGILNQVCFILGTATESLSIAYFVYW